MGDARMFSGVAFANFRELLTAGASRRTTGDFYRDCAICP